MTYSIYDGPRIFAAAADPKQGRGPAPFGPFRRRRKHPNDLPPSPGFGLLAVDPATFSTGRRRLKLRHAAMATGAFTMMSVGMSSHPTLGDAVTRPASLGEATSRATVDEDETVDEDTSEAADEPAATTDAADVSDGQSGQVAEPAAPEPDKQAAVASESTKKEPSKKEPTKKEPKAAAKKPWAPAPIAEFQGVRIHEISDKTKLVGFHEAAYNIALPMTPTDPPTVNHGAGNVASHREGHARVADLLVLPTRLRDTAPNSALDVAVKAGERVLAPIDGTVTAVRHYRLYGKYPDTRIEIVPKGRPDLQLTVLHVSHPFVKVGDKIVGGKTPFAGHATAFPFESQIDRFSEARTGSSHPHVHMEFKHR